MNGQPIESGVAEDNYKLRFRKSRIGVYSVLEPVMNPSLYWKMTDTPDELEYNEQTMG